MIFRSLPLARKKYFRTFAIPSEYGAISSVGRAPDCGSGCRGFEPHIAPQKEIGSAERRPFSFWCASAIDPPCAPQGDKGTVPLAPLLRRGYPLSRPSGPPNCPKPASPPLSALSNGFKPAFPPPRAPSGSNSVPVGAKWGVKCSYRDIPRHGRSNISGRADQKLSSIVAISV